LIFLLPACAPEARRQVVPPPEPEIPAPPPLQLEGLDLKIAALEKILLSQDLSNEDRMTAQNLLVVYGTIREDLKYPLLAKDYQKIIGLLYGSLAEIDEPYLKRAAAAESAAAARVVLFSEKRRSIVDSYVSGNHQAVVDGYADLAKAFGSDNSPKFVNGVLGSVSSLANSSS